MSLEQELYEERRRKLRRTSFLRGILAASIFFSIAGILWKGDWFASPHIASFEVSGEIFDDVNRDSIFREISENENVYGLLVRINSPGGSVVGAEGIYKGLREVGEKKPVVITIGEIGASAAYIAALAGDRIFARENSLIGSIGVVIQYPDISRLAERLGVSVEIVKSGKLKGEPNILKGMDKQVRKANEILVNDSFNWFKKLVVERRNIDTQLLNEISDGRLFTGRMAAKLGLIDEIGSKKEAMEYLQSRDSKLVNIPIKSWNIENTSTSIWGSIFGLSENSGILRKLYTRVSPTLFSVAG